MTDTPLLVVILAETARHARTRAAELDLGPAGWIYASSARTLRGRRDIRVELGHRYWRHPQAEAISQELRIIQATSTRSDFTALGQNW